MRTTTIASLDRVWIPPGTAALAAREVDVVLRDGASVHVRPVRTDDLPALRAFLGRACPAGVDRHERDGLIAMAGADGAATIVGHAAWVRIGGERAEVAFETAGTMHGRGLATILLAQLAFGARAQGIATFVAEVPPERHATLSAFRDSGLPVHVRSEPGVLRVEMPTALTEETRERFERRDAIAAVAAIDSVLRPRSLVVVGASPDPDTIGGVVFRKLVEGGCAGALYAINQRRRNVLGHHCFPSIDAIPDEIEAAVLAVPAAQWAPVARACAAHGVRALIVLAGGFAETGAEGLASQRELLAICQAARMRLLGPSCLGMVNTDPAVRLDASFVPRTPPRGHVGLLSRSGTGVALLEQVRARGIGLSVFVSVGEQADLSGDDVLQWCEQDERTRAILLDPASFADPRTFARIARRVGRVKPILALKPGRSATGASPAVSRSSALVASSETAADAVFRRAGVLRTDTLAELLDLAALLEHQPLPRGPRVAIVTNAGESAQLTADACVAAGLELSTLPDATQAKAGRAAPMGAALGNPVDLLATATPEAFQAAIEAIATSGAVDAIIAVLAPALVAEAEDLAAATREAGRTLAGRLPLLTCLMTADRAPAALYERTAEDDAPPLPAFRRPEDAARALGHAAVYARWRATPHGTVPAFEDVRPDEAAAIVARALGATDAAAEGDGDATGGWLDPHDVDALLACYGVASKAIAPALPAGRELFVGAACDPLVGPVVVCGAGGRAVEPPHDVAVRPTPLTDRDAREMVTSLSPAPRSQGASGEPPVDLPAFEQIVLRIGALVAAHPEIAELDCDPVIAYPGGAVVAHARVRVASLSARSAR